MVEDQKEKTKKIQPQKEKEFLTPIKSSHEPHETEEMPSPNVIIIDDKCEALVNRPNGKES